jgi:hypothetical protein
MNRDCETIVSKTGNYKKWNWILFLFLFVISLGLLYDEEPLKVLTEYFNSYNGLRRLGFFCTEIIKTNFINFESR